MSVQAMSDVWDRSPYVGDRLVVHLAIADVVNDVYDHKLWMHRTELARKARVSRATVDRTLRDLVEDGWLEVLVAGGGRGKPTEYRYNLSAKPRHCDAVTDETASPTAETASNGEVHPLIELKEPKRARSRRKPETRIASPFVVDDDMQSWVMGLYPHLDWQVATREWTTAAVANDWLFRDWGAAWKNGMHRAARWHKTERNERGATRTHL